MARIRNRITLFLISLLITALFVAALCALQFLESSRIRALQASLLADAQWLGATLAQHPEHFTDAAAVAAQSLHQDAALLTASGVAAVVQADGRITPASDWRYTPIAATVQAGAVVSAKVDSQTMLVAAAAVPGTKDRVALVDPVQPQYIGLLADWRWLTAEFTVIALVSALAVALWSRRATAPLEQIAATTEAIANGDVHRRIPYWGQDEYGRISSAINSLTSSLSERMNDVAQEKNKIQGIIAQMASGVLVVDKTGVILVANEVAHAQLGNHHQQLIGRTHWEAAVPRVSAAIDAVLMKGEAQRKELTLPADLSVELNVTPIFGTHSEVVGAVAVLHDVSQFRQVERMRSEFVANVSHELRTPITAVRGFAETLLDGAIENPELRRQFVQIIYDEADRLNHLVVDLLELSKIESGHSIFHFEPADLGVLAENAADTLRHQAEQHGLALEVHLPEAPVVAEVAAERILQVLVNLIGNAIAYTPAPGRVDLTVLDGEATVQLVVQDTGIGIPQADIPRIFERFYRVDKDRSRRTGGTGLGLAIVKHIVEVHHGNIQVESQVGKGSIFRVNLPKRQMPNAAHPTGSAGNNFTNESQAHMLLS